MVHQVSIHQSHGSRTVSSDLKVRSWVPLEGSGPARAKQTTLTPRLVPDGVGIVLQVLGNGTVGSRRPGAPHFVETTLHNALELDDVGVGAVHRGVAVFSRNTVRYLRGLLSDEVGCDSVGQIQVGGVVGSFVQSDESRHASSIEVGEMGKVVEAAAVSLLLDTVTLDKTVFVDERVHLVPFLASLVKVVLLEAGGARGKHSRSFDVETASNGAATAVLLVGVGVVHQTTGSKVDISSDSLESASGCDDVFVVFCDIVSLDQRNGPPESIVKVSGVVQSAITIAGLTAQNLREYGVISIGILLDKWRVVLCAEVGKESHNLSIVPPSRRPGYRGWRLVVGVQLLDGVVGVIEVVTSLALLNRSTGDC